MFIFNLFISEYLYHILPCSMEGDEGDIFSNAPDWKALFLLKAEIKQNPGFPSKEYNSIFELIYQNIRAYPRRKKICIDHWLGKCYYILGGIQTKQGLGKQVWFVPSTFGR